MNCFQRTICINNIVLYLALVTIIALPACAVKIVADYDASIYKQILQTEKLVDNFYITLQTIKKENREYNQYVEKYLQIETKLRSLYTKNKSRTLNDESIKISKSILNLWIKYKKNHEITNTYSEQNIKLDKNHFQQLFTSAANAETSKIIK